MDGRINVLIKLWCLRHSCWEGGEASSEKAGRRKLAIRPLCLPWEGPALHWQGRRQKTPPAVLEEGKDRGEEGKERGQEEMRSRGSTGCPKEQ